MNNFMYSALNMTRLPAEFTDIFNSPTAETVAELQHLLTVLPKDLSILQGDDNDFHMVIMDDTLICKEGKGSVMPQSVAEALDYLKKNKKAKQLTKESEIKGPDELQGIRLYLMEEPITNRLLLVFDSLEDNS